MVGAKQEDEQGLRVAAGDGVNARLHGDDTTSWRGGWLAHEAFQTVSEPSQGPSNNVMLPM